MKKIAVILMCAMMFSSTVIILGNGNADDVPDKNDESIAEFGLGGLWNPAGPRESETCHIISPETLLRDNPNPLPSAVDNSAGLPPVGNQRSQGSCTAWAIGYYHTTYIENRESPIDMTAPENQTSPAFLYNIANSGYDSGSYMSDVADLLISNGACSMAEKPYSPTDLTSWPEEDWIWVSGMKRKAIAQNWLEATQTWGMDALKSHLAAGNTATTGIYVWSNFDNIGNYNYTYSSAEKYGTNRGGHVVTICGYDDDFPTADGPGALRMVNSWGTSWGEAGYWWLSYGALHDYDLCQSGWVMYLESEVNYEPKMVAKARIDHECRGDIFRNSGLRVIAYENDEEVWSKPFLSCHWMEYYAGSTQQHPFPAGRMAFDISDALNFMQDDFQIFVLYAENSRNVEGEIVNFEILNGEWWCGGVSPYVPMAIEPYSVMEPEAWVQRGVFEHVPIRADGDAGLAQRAIGEMWEGDGTPGSPYVIRGYTIDGTGMGNCIYVGNTTCHFEIMDCTVGNASSDEWSDYHADSGIYLFSASNGAVWNCTMRGSLIGLFLVECFNMTMEDNEADENTFGFLISLCSDTVVRRNRISDSVEYGIYVETSNGILLYHNELNGNTIQACDDTSLNAWDNGYPSGGNFWSDYSGMDQLSGPGQNLPSSDGIGDMPYLDINGGMGAMDNYPLMEPWGSPELVQLYLQVQNSIVPGYKNLSTEPFETSIQIAGTGAIVQSGEHILQNKWISDPLTHSASIAGTWTFDMYGYVTNSSVLGGHLFARVYKESTGELLFETERDDENVSAFETYHHFTWAQEAPDIMLDTGDRYYVEIWLDAERYGDAITESTANPDFTGGTDGWTFFNWGGGTGNWISGAASIDVYRDDRVFVLLDQGGYWEQAFTPTSVPSSVSLTFSWTCSNYYNLYGANFYVFIDTFSGTPTANNAIWSTSVSGWSPWVTVGPLDVSQHVNSASTYYLKVAARATTPGGSLSTFRGMYDNVQVTWNVLPEFVLGFDHNSTPSSITGAPHTPPTTPTNLTVEHWGEGNPYEHNTLNWTHDGSEFVEHFNIYRSESDSGPWEYVDSVPGNTFTFVDMDRGRADWILWWYIVRAQNSVGEDGNTNAVMEPYISSFNISISAGWNLISIPIIQTDTSVEGVLSTISGNWDVVKYYDSTDASDPWKTYRVNGTHNDLWYLDSTMGFWLHATEACNLTVNGVEFESTSITLYAGWNLVGYPSITEISVGDAFWGTSADRVEVFDPASPYMISAVAPEYIMKPGEGYWVRVPADTVWVIDW